MFKTQEELKSFILWAIDQKITRVKVDKVEVEISAYAFIDKLGTSPEPSQVPEPQIDEAAKEQAKEDDELQYWSSIP